MQQISQKTINIQRGKQLFWETKKIFEYAQVCYLSRLAFIYYLYLYKYKSNI